MSQSDICNRCGQANDLDSKFCYNCGEKLQKNIKKSIFNDFYQDFNPRNDLELEIYKKEIILTIIVSLILSFSNLIILIIQSIIYFPSDFYLIVFYGLRIIFSISIISISAKVCQLYIKVINIDERSSLANILGLILITSLSSSFFLTLFIVNISNGYYNFNSIAAGSINNSVTIISVVFVTLFAFNSSISIMANGYITKNSLKFQESNLIPIISGSMFYLTLTYVLQYLFLSSGGSFSYYYSQFLIFSIFNFVIWIGTILLFYYFFNQKIEYAGMLSYPNNLIKTGGYFFLVYYVIQVSLSILFPFNNFLNLFSIISSLEFIIFFVLDLYFALILFSYSKLRNKDSIINQTFNNATS